MNIKFIKIKYLLLTKLYKLNTKKVMVNSVVLYNLNYWVEKYRSKIAFGFVFIFLNYNKFKFYIENYRVSYRL